MDYGLGVLSRELGDYQSAYKYLDGAYEAARSDGTRIAPALALEWGNLLWATGQYARALQIYLDPDTRRQLAAQSPDFLARGHISAAKCAIDLDDFTTAQKELTAAKQLLRESERISPLTEGYYFIYFGELHLASRAQVTKGFDLLEQACDHFNEMDPPFHPGLLDAKITIARYAIRLDDHLRMLKVLHNMLEEAEQHGCLEARARLMLIESSMFVSDNPPLEAAFKDLVTRLHVINNPALLMQALANLYIYSLRYLNEPDQAFLMGRMRNLQDVLDRSCYQDLYETYVEKRYSWAIENRLAEFLEQDEKLFADDLTHDDDHETTT